MNEPPSAQQPTEKDAKPSLLATVSLILGLIPWVMMGVRILVDKMEVFPTWLVDLLSVDPHALVVSLAFISLIGWGCGLVALIRLKRDLVLRGRWKAVTGIIFASLFMLFSLLAHIPIPIMEIPD
jgi:hypothetical protein